MSVFKVFFFLLLSAFLKSNEAFDICSATEWRIKIKSTAPSYHFSKFRSKMRQIHIFAEVNDNYKDYSSISSSTDSYHNNIIGKPKKKDMHSSKYSPYKRKLRTSTLENGKNSSQQLFHANSGGIITMGSVLRSSYEGNSRYSLELFKRYCHNNTSLDLKDCNILLRNLGDRGDLESCNEVFHLMVQFGLEPSLVTYSTLISRAGNWQKANLALHYYSLMTKNGVKADIQTYNSLINLYAKAGDLNKAGEVLKSMASQGLQPNVVTLNTLIDGCARSCSIKEAYSLVDQFNKLGIKPNERTLCTLLHAHCKVGDHRGAEEILQQILDREFGNSYLITAFSTLIHSYGLNGMLKEAFAALESMKAKGIKPNVVIMSSLIHACGRLGELGPAFSLYNIMCQSPQMKPNSITFSSLVDCCLKCGEVDKAFSVVQDMRLRGVQLNEVTYTSLITELTKLGQIDRIIEVMLGESDENTDMLWRERSDKLGRKKAVFPTSARTISSPVMSEDEQLGSKQTSVDWETQQRKVLSSLASIREVSGGNKGDEIVLDIVDSLLAEGYVLKAPILELAVASVTDLHSAQRVKNILRKLDNTDDIMETLKQKEESLVQEEGSDTGHLSIEASSSVALAKSGKLASAISNYEQMKEKGASLGASEYKNLIDAIYESLQGVGESITEISLPSEAAEPPASFAEVSLSSSTTSSNIDERRLNRHAQLFRLYLVYQEMRAAQIQPDAAVYNTLINACAGAGDLEKAFETLETMRSEGIEPDVITYTSLIKACVKVGGVDAVAVGESIFADMQQRTNHFSNYVEPNSITYQRLLQLHLKGLEINMTRVRELFEEMQRRCIDIDNATYFLFIKAASLTEDGKFALQVVNFMRPNSTSLPGNSISRCWQLAASVCRQCGLHEQADALLKDLSAIGLSYHME